MRPVQLIELCDESPDEAGDVPARAPAPLPYDIARPLLADPGRWYGERTGGCTLVRSTQLGRGTPVHS